MLDKQLLEQVLADQLRSFLSEESLAERDVSIIPHLTTPEITVITGVRRCGKSTLMKLVARQIQNEFSIFYIDLDDSRLFDFTLQNFQDALEIWLKWRQKKENRIVFFFDEIQNIAGWERWVTALAKNANYKVCITGSNATLLSSDLATHLTGRYTTIALMPFSFPEAVRLSNRSDMSSIVWRKSTEGRVALRRRLEEYLQFGGFPRAILSRSTHVLPQYYKDILEKDIIHHHDVRNRKGITALGRLLMSDVTKLFNKSSAAHEIGIERPATIGNYCSYFEECYLVSEVKGFSYSVRKQSRSLPKYYAVDVALARSVSFGFSANDGVALEQLVFLELLRREKEIFYWRSVDGFEVDFVTSRGKGIDEAIQVSLALSIPKTRERELRALEVVQRELNVKKLTLITLDESEPEIALGKGSVRVVSFADWALAPWE